VLLENRWKGKNGKLFVFCDLFEDGANNARLYSHKRWDAWLEKNFKISEGKLLSPKL
jgi:hypothetical protein